MYEHSELTKSVVICPYNKSHLIARSRIQRHIVKCEQNYPEGYKLMCPYNAIHRLSKHEMQEHIITCPNRSISEPRVYAGVKTHGSTSLMLHSENSSVINCDESWDTKTDDDWKFLINEDQTLLNDSGVYLKDLDTSVQKKDLTNEVLRPPRGFSEAMLKDVDEESYVEDVESVVSAMGVGRGKVSMKSDRVIKLIGLGRGQSINKNS